MKTNEKSVTGLVSLILFGSGVSLLFFTALLTYLPRDNDFRGLLTWLGLLVGFGFVFLGIPMLVASLVTGILTIAKNSRSRAGYTVLIGNAVLALGAIFWLFR